VPGGVGDWGGGGGVRAGGEEVGGVGAAAPGADAQAHAARQAELEQRIAGAVLAAPPVDRAEIRFGARVRAATASGDVRDVHIVGVDEADPAAHAIAFVAPLARALLGRRAGDVISVRTPGGEEELTVLSIAYDD